MSRVLYRAELRQRIEDVVGETGLEPVKRLRAGGLQPPPIAALVIHPNVLVRDARLELARSEIVSTSSWWVYQFPQSRIRDYIWWARRELNSHVRRQQGLNLPRLPITPLAPGEIAETRTRTSCDDAF